MQTTRAMLLLCTIALASSMLVAGPRHRANWAGSQAAQPNVGSDKPAKGWVAACDDATTAAKQRRKARKQQRFQQQTQAQQQTQNQQQSSQSPSNP
ncbi:MAG: hypothetical protein KatS3mg130_0216 [Candidatus Sumerlaea sp.]|nr:hypothetical protein [Candidatus Sumerlaea chitinivorans]GIX43808.1 MAG: hypothetical protein KatS3mg130_0216 [Candidatus Sumerlaea sp.]